MTVVSHDDDDGFDVTEYDVVIQAQPKQELFLSSPADITVYGGAAGGGKTWALLMEPLRHIDNPRFGAVIFRNTFSQVVQEGGMWDETHLIYPYCGGVAHKGRLYWQFPKGSRVRFGYLNHENDKYVYHGAQIPLLCFDQLEQFSAPAFFYMLSRNRSMSGVRGYIRATCNPDAESWLAAFLAWWIADDGFADLARAGVIRWFKRVGGDLIWADTAAELAMVGSPEASPKSVTFIPSTVYDNEILLTRDPDYLSNLHALLPLDRARLLGDPERGGNWKIKAGAGMIFHRDWFEVVPVIPPGGRAVLYWDFAATAKEQSGGKANDPDWTAGVLMVEVDNVYYWALTVAFQAGPAETDRRFKNRSLQIAQQVRQAGRTFSVRWEIEPGSAGKRLNVQLVKMLAGLDAGGVPESGDKLVRAKPLAQMCMAGNVKMLAADWNETTLQHLHNQPQWPHDDIMDAGAGAYNALTGDYVPEPASEQVEMDLGVYKADWEVRAGGLLVPRRGDRIFGRERRRGRRRG